MNVHAVLLVRDPRGTMHSRKYAVGFCSGHSDCDSAEVLCRDMVDDYNASMELAMNYPDRYT